MLPQESVEQNLLALFRHFAAAHDSGEAREMPGVTIASSGVAFQMFNAAFLSEPVRDGAFELERRIAIAAVHFAARDLRWAYWICEHKLDMQVRNKVQAVFHKNSLGLAFLHPGMFAESLLAPVRALPSLEIRRVADEPARLAFAHINAMAFGVSFGSCAELYNRERLWSGDFVGYVGYEAGDPVTTAATMTAAGAVGIYCVATLPNRCRKGYAEVIVRYALAKVREASGVERSILQSTASALPLYERMGYKTVTRFLVFSSV